jgi:hypothetical protein
VLGGVLVVGAVLVLHARPKRPVAATG